MTKKGKEQEYNLNPQNLTDAKSTIKKMNAKIQKLATELTKSQQETTKKTQEWQAATDELNREKSQAKNNNQNTPLTQDQIIAQAKDLGMKTQAEYQAALVKDTAIPESGDYSWLWLIGGAIIILGGLGLIKTKS